MTTGSPKNKSLLAIFLFLIASGGCGSGEQQGGYAVSYVRANLFNDPEGFMVAFYGNELAPDSQVIGHENGQLFIIFVGQHDFASGYDRTDVRDTRLTSTFSMHADGHVLSIFWNRETGVIEVAGKTFNRKNGNVIVLTDGDENAEDIQLNVRSERTDGETVIDSIVNQKQALGILENWASARGGTK